MSVFFSYYFLSAESTQSFNFKLFCRIPHSLISLQKLMINRADRAAIQYIFVFSLISEYCLHLWLFYFSLIEATLNKSDWLILHLETERAICSRFPLMCFNVLQNGGFYNDNSHYNNNPLLLKNMMAENN